MMAGRRGVDLSQTTRQNICQIRGLAFRKIARHVIRALEGEDAATEERIRHLAKDEDFQNLVGEVFTLHCAAAQ